MFVFPFVVDDGTITVFQVQAPHKTRSGKHQMRVMHCRGEGWSTKVEFDNTMQYKEYDGWAIHAFAEAISDWDRFECWPEDSKYYTRVGYLLGGIDNMATPCDKIMAELMQHPDRYPSLRPYMLHHLGFKVEYPETLTIGELCGLLSVIDIDIKLTNFDQWV